MPIATRPPDAMCEVGVGVHVGVGSTTMPPSVLTVDVPPTRASMSAPSPTSASAPAPAPEKRPPMISVKASASFQPVAVTLTLSVAVLVVVASPSKRASTRPFVSALAMAIATEPRMPREPMRSRPRPCCWRQRRPLSSIRASTRILPDDVSCEPDPTTASMSALSSIVAKATAPVIPISPRLTTLASAAALWSPIALTVDRGRVGDVAVDLCACRPTTVAIGTIAVMLMPPPPPPGVLAMAVLWLRASTNTAPVVRHRCGRGERRQRQTVTVGDGDGGADGDRADGDVDGVDPHVLVGIGDDADAAGEPTRCPDDPALADVVPVTLMMAIAAERARPPPCTEIASDEASTSLNAWDVDPSDRASRAERADVADRVAVVSPERLATPMPAPAAATPPAIPTVTISRSRSAAASMSMPPEAAGTLPLANEASWVASELMTTTWAPTATTPPPPVKATPTMSSS